MSTEYIYKDLTYKIIGCLYEVHRELGSIHKEKIYHKAITIELKNRNIRFEEEKPLSVKYKGKKIGVYKPDFIIEDKVILEIKVVPIITKAIFDQIFYYIKNTDYKLALLAKNVTDENIQKGIIGTSEVLFGNSPDNLSILIPIPDKIHLLRDQIFATSGLGPETPGDTQGRMQAEGAKISLYNGTGFFELLDKTAQYMGSQGANIVEASAAGQAYASTVIIDYTGNPHTLRYLVDTLGIHPSNIHIEFDPNSQTDVVVFLGNDWATSNPLP